MLSIWVGPTEIPLSMSHAPKPIHLLLVEDNPGDALLLRSMLRDRSNFEVTEAASLMAAKAALAQAAFDAALVDLSLPDSDGLETVDALHAVAPEVPIVVLTGITDEDVALAAVRRGAQDYLVKGRADATRVARAIRYAIDRKLAEVQLEKARADLERKVLERTADLQRLNRTLQMTGACTQAVVHLADEEQLTTSICRIISDPGGYKVARVIYSEDDGASDLRVMASAGPASVSPGDAVAPCARTAPECELVKRAVRLGQVGICRAMPPDSESASFHTCAFNEGFRSAVALPLISDGRTFGALIIYAEEVDAFDSDQIGMVRGLADDLAFGIMASRARAERDRAQGALVQRAEQLRALAAELAAAEQRERRRVAQILHDQLQQTLVGAKYQVEAAKAQTRTKAVRETMDRLSEILDESIKTSRSLTAELGLPILHEKNLAGALKWLAGRMRERHGLQVVIDADAFAEPLSEDVRAFLFEAVRELLFNVVKHAGVNEAQVRLFRQEEDIRVEVSDAGRGFDSDRLQRRGTADFGLFSIRERLGYLGGHVEIASAPSQGTRITLVTHVPRTAERPTEAQIHRPGTEGRSARRIRILLADDHPIVRHGLGSLLRDQPDVEVVGEAADGQEAVDMARQLRPDVVVMDVNMPRMDGCDATRQIVAECPGVRVIGLSMHAHADVGAALREAGAVAYLTKRGSLPDLVAAIRATVERPKD
jgi:DNA-binding NarL/FixJ family response regulator/two-component sensor histidine kinase